MIKKILKPITIAAFTFIAGYNVYLANVDNYTLTDAMLANVEALAQDEDNYYDNRYPLSMKCGVMIDDGCLWDTTCEVTIITCQGGGSGCTPSHALYIQDNVFST